MALKESGGRGLEWGIGTAGKTPSNGVCFKAVGFARLPGAERPGLYPSGLQLTS